jgi:hypothetical protein
MHLDLLRAKALLKKANETVSKNAFQANHSSVAGISGRNPTDQ